MEVTSFVVTRGQAYKDLEYFNLLTRSFDKRFTSNALYENLQRAMTATDLVPEKLRKTDRPVVITPVTLTCGEFTTGD